MSFEVHAHAQEDFDAVLAGLPEAQEPAL